MRPRHKPTLPTGPLYHDPPQDCLRPPPSHLGEPHRVARLVDAFVDLVLAARPRHPYSPVMMSGVVRGGVVLACFCVEKKDLFTKWVKAIG